MKESTRKSSKAVLLQEFVNAIREMKGLDPLYGEREHAKTAPRTYPDLVGGSHAMASGCRWVGSMSDR